MQKRASDSKKILPFIYLYNLKKIESEEKYFPTLTMKKD
jgi:hypothetical protein